MADTRTLEQLRQHYEIEKELANRLRNATKEERRTLFGEVYDEMFRRVPLHPQHVQKQSPEIKAASVARQYQFLKRFIKPSDTYLEVGAGDCAVALEMTKHVKQVYAVDVSDEVTKGFTPPSNFKLILSDGTSIPVPPNSVQVAYSNQLMEHLHPDDALEQLQNIYHALSPGGRYVCITPSRLSGPHDVSEAFDSVATGFHLKEYTVTELKPLFKKVGFAKCSFYVMAKNFVVRMPMFAILAFEALLNALPRSLSVRIARNPVL
ncbi:MAG TPA: class I SAM-dependent methyltransferase [Pirellulales bacterium]|jgi:ubiquinone/menaquinone biosynthesis C-methylase UbiE